MRLSREKIVRISHQLVELLVASNEVEFVEDRDSIRQHMVQTMTNILREEEKIEAEVRKRITSRKKRFSKAAKNGTCFSANTTPMSCVARALPPHRKNTKKPATASPNV